MIRLRMAGHRRVAADLLRQVAAAVMGVGQDGLMAGSGGSAALPVIDVGPLAGGAVGCGAGGVWPSRSRRPAASAASST